MCIYTHVHIAVTDIHTHMGGQVEGTGRGTIGVTGGTGERYRWRDRGGIGGTHCHTQKHHQLTYHAVALPIFHTIVSVHVSSMQIQLILRSSCWTVASHKAGDTRWQALGRKEDPLISRGLDNQSHHSFVMSTYL